MDQVTQSIERCAADGAYDRSSCYKSCFERNTKLITPPRKGAILQNPETYKPEMIVRDKAIKRIERLEEELGSREAALKQWKKEEDYHIRSIAENSMYRLKRICGDSLFSRREDSQKVEAKIKVNILNTLTSLGMPETYIANT